jgi:hypothetical protein
MKEDHWDLDLRPPHRDIFLICVNLCSSVADDH